jgi:hypothetical protein
MAARVLQVAEGAYQSREQYGVSLSLVHASIGWSNTITLGDLPKPLRARDIGLFAPDPGQAGLNRSMS